MKIKDETTKYSDAVKAWGDAWSTYKAPCEPPTQSTRPPVVRGKSVIRAIPITPWEEKQRDRAMMVQYHQNAAERERDKDPAILFWHAASLYCMGAASSTEAAQLCGLSRVGFLFRLPSVGVPISNLTVEDLDDEF